jgi:hypothetical protein
VKLGSYAEFLNRIFIGSHSLPPSLVRRFGLSQIPTIAARAWEGAAAPKVCMTAVGGMHARVPKAGRMGDDMVVAGP